MTYAVNPKVETQVNEPDDAVKNSSDSPKEGGRDTGDNTSPIEAAQWIKDSIEEIKFGSDTVAIAMDLPSGSRIGPSNLLKAIEIVLREYFIKVPEDIGKKIAAGETAVFDFVAPAKERHLRPRQVEINTMPGISTLTIRGSEPVDGDNGFVKLFFDFKVQPGKLLPNGRIDFREVNRFPQASKDQLVIRIYEPSSGSEGTDVMGFPIRAKAGTPAQVKIKDGFYSRDDMDPEYNRRMWDYFAHKAGIVVCEFEGPAEVENLRSISIQNEIKVKDIDFSTGNFKGESNEVRCKADLIVDGDIRGCFAVIIDGSLVVNGAVEGETVDATGPVIVNFARNFVRSGSDMEIGSARKATLMAKGKLHIKKEISEGVARADELLLQPIGSTELLLGKCVLAANKIFGSAVNVRNMVEIEVGEKLFQLYSQLKVQERDLSAEIERKKEALMSRGAVFGQKLQLAKNILVQENKQLIPVLKQFASMILLGSLSIDKLKARMSAIEQKLKYELHMLTKQLRLMLEIQEELSALKDKKELLGEQIDKTEKAIDELSVELSGNMSDAGQIVLRCNGFEKKVMPRDLQGGKFRLTMKYDPTKGPQFSLESA